MRSLFSPESRLLRAVTNVTCSLQRSWDWYELFVSTRTRFLRTSGSGHAKKTSETAAHRRPPVCQLVTISSAAQVKPALNLSTALAVREFVSEHIHIRRSVRQSLDYACQVAHSKTLSRDCRHVSNGDC